MFLVYSYQEGRGLVFKLHPFWLVFLQNFSGYFNLKICFWTVVDIQNIVFKYAFFDGPIWLDELALTVLSSKLPMSLVDSTVAPVHLAIAVPFVMFIPALIIIAGLPDEFAMTMLKVIQVIPIVLVGGWIVRFLPFSLAMLHCLDEVAGVGGSRFPSVLALAVR